MAKHNFGDVVTKAVLSKLVRYPTTAFDVQTDLIAEHGYALPSAYLILPAFVDAGFVRIVDRDPTAMNVMYLTYELTPDGSWELDRLSQLAS